MSKIDNSLPRSTSLTGEDASSAAEIPPSTLGCKITENQDIRIAVVGHSYFFKVTTGIWLKNCEVFPADFLLDKTYEPLVEQIRGV
mmetsp:Transcript_9407/g.14379  ORF Transcript_9407/g.14379 Transcript_9407/m.14379 type:complete len:86 (-) Transcript_9407:388-645(-)